MKLYRNLLQAVGAILQDIFKNKRYADKAIESAFKKNPQWGARDRRFVAEGVYDITRHFRLYSTLAHSEDNFWFITAVWLVVKKTELPDWPEFRHLNERQIHADLERLKQVPEIWYSYPDWLWQMLRDELGDEALLREAEAMNGAADVFLRTNTLKTSRDKLLQYLKAKNTDAEPVKNSDAAIRLKKRQNVFALNIFKEGLFEVQDEGSQAITTFLAPRTGETFIDACAGAGGKSLHAAALMSNKGSIISLDVEMWKLDELKKRAKRAGAHNVQARLIREDQIPDDLFGKADKLLLDVPCSGLGVLRRNPDAKWKLSPEVIERTRLLQQKILGNYWKMLKVKGQMVYSTCSILPSENQQQIHRFLRQQPQFSLEAERIILPSSGSDGFYMARLSRNS